MVQNILIIFIISFVLSAVFTPLLRLIALKREFLSYPGVRRIHTKPVPYLGGIAMYFAFFMALLYIFSVPSGKISGTGLTHCHFEGLAIAAAFIVIVGFIDDVREIKPLAKLAAQIISAVILFIYGFRIPVLTNVFSGVETKLPFFFSFFLTIFWIVGFMNAMNLIDGLDGLAAGITSIACFSLFFVALYLNNYLTAFLLAALAGSSLGFLIYNFHPAKIFMGDAGSMFLGLVLASSALVGSQYKSTAATAFLIPFTALAIPMSDTFLAIVRRLFKKTPIFKADKKHLHHRLLDLGLTQPQIVIFIYLITIYLGIFAFLFVLIPEKYAFILLILLTLGFLMVVRMLGFLERRIGIVCRLEMRSKKRKGINEA